MAFVTSFTGATLTTPSTFVNPSKCANRPRRVQRAKVVALFTPAVDEFMASSVHGQYIAKACPSGVPPLQCIEGATADQPYALRTLKRQSQLRYFQLPTSVKIHNYYEIRKAAVVAAHGCSHEENRALAYPTMAAAYLMGQAEASKACVRYFHTDDPAEKCMTRAVENRYQQAVNPAGTFSTACTDGQAGYEAYLMQVRCRSTEFRARQYSAAEKAGMKFAARKQALTQKGHDCNAEEVLFCKYPIVASAMRPTIGYYPPFVSSPTQPYTLGVQRPSFSPAALIAAAGTAALLLGYAVTHAPGAL